MSKDVATSKRFSVLFEERCDCGAEFNVHAAVGQFDFEFSLGMYPISCPECHAVRYLRELPLRVTAAEGVGRSSASYSGSGVRPLGPPDRNA